MAVPGKLIHEATSGSAPNYSLWVLSPPSNSLTQVGCSTVQLNSDTTPPTSESNHKRRLSPVLLKADHRHKGSTALACILLIC